MLPGVYRQDRGKMESNFVQLAVLLMCFFSVQVKRVTAECRYQYTKEPLSDITCNPYTSPHQRMDCNFLITSADFQIQWLYMVPGGVEPVLLGMSRHSILLNGIARLESYLVIINLRPGIYYCQLSVEGLTPFPLPPSSMAVISTPDSYNTLPACDNLSQTSTKCAEELNDHQSVLVPTSGIVSQNGLTIDMSNLVIQMPPPENSDRPPIIDPLPTTTQNLDASTELSIHVTTTPFRPAPTESTALALWVLIVVALGATFVVLLSVTVSIVCCCYCARRMKGKRRRTAIRPGMDITLSTRTTTSLLPNPTSDTTSPHYSTITSEGSYHYYSHPQWPETDYHSIAEDSDRTYSYPNRHYFLASSRRCESECDDTSYLSSSYATEPGATLIHEEPVATATDTSNTAPHTEYDNISSSYVIATLHEEPTDTSNTVPHSDGYKDLDPTRMEDQHGYTDTSQETKKPPTVSRGGKDYHTINPTLRETHPYALPGAVGQRVRGSNGAQSGIKSQSDDRSPDCPYQGLKIESMDYASLYNMGKRISKEQGGK